MRKRANKTAKNEVRDFYDLVFESVRKNLATSVSEYSVIPNAVTKDSQRVTQMKLAATEDFNAKTGGTWESVLESHTLQMMEYIHEKRLIDAESECVKSIVFLLRCAVRLRKAQIVNKRMRKGDK